MKLIMKILVAPAGPKTATATIRSLLEQSDAANIPVDVKAIYRDLRKVPAEFTSQRNFKAVQGDVSNPLTLDFTGTDVVFAITPPAFDGRDLVAHAEQVSQNVKDAIERAGTVKKLVLLSSMGAHLSEGIGEIKTNNRAEEILSRTNVPEVLIARCAYFMDNWANCIPTLRLPQAHIESIITPTNFNIPMVAVKDIGKLLAKELMTSNMNRKSPCIVEVCGPTSYSPGSVAASFTMAMSKMVTIIPIPPDDLQTYWQRFFLPNVAREYAEMTRSFLPGGRMNREPDPIQREVLRGETDLKDLVADIVQIARQRIPNT